MTNLDLSPLFRSTIGFDRVSQLLESTLANDSAPTYPPYNIEQVGEDAFRIVMAIAGFSEADIEMVVKENTLFVSGKLAEKDGDVHYLHRGIAGRAFERRFELAEHIEVESARLENGLLVVELQREIPEALKPRNIAITNGKGKRKPKPLEHKDAA